jgi:hypothetical protein
MASNVARRGEVALLGDVACAFIAPFIGCGSPLDKSNRSAGFLCPRAS